MSWEKIAEALNPCPADQKTNGTTIPTKKVPEAYSGDSEVRIDGTASTPSNKIVKSPKQVMFPTNDEPTSLPNQATGPGLNLKESYMIVGTALAANFYSNLEG